MSELPINTHEQVGQGGVYVAYYPAEARMVMASRAQVIRVGFKTDPTAAWYDYGNKTFLGKMRESVPQAKEWAEKKYGIKKWKRNSMGHWIDADQHYLPLRERT